MVPGLVLLSVCYLQVHIPRLLFMVKILLILLMSYLSSLLLIVTLFPAFNRLNSDSILDLFEDFKNYPKNILDTGKVDTLVIKC